MRDGMDTHNHMPQMAMHPDCEESNVTVKMMVLDPVYKLKLDY